MTERLIPTEPNTYERPNVPFRCGRSVLWDRPCWQGATAGGKCGGAALCSPTKKGDRWECRRPRHAGGPCEFGPRPDGTCSTTRPPCSPRPTIRRLRGRIGLIASILVIALVATLADFAPGPSAAISSLDPGPLSSAHQGFTSERGCVSCHREHGDDTLGWLASAFQPSDQTDRCLTCHSFSGEERTAHNIPSAEGGKIGPECGTCHAEHQGSDHDISRVTDQTCSNCHEPTVSDFVKDHPIFPNKFPYQIPNNIYFDHNKHLNEYFDPDSRYMKGDDRDAEFAAKAKSACTTCHIIESATREVKPRPFESTCAGCHNQQIGERAMVLMIPDEGTPLLGLIHEVDALDDEEAVLEKQTALLESFPEEGLTPIGEAIDALNIGTDATRLLEGLTPELLRGVASAWLQEEEYEAPEPSDYERGGWRAGVDADGNESIRYVPRRHAYSIMVRWLSLARRLAIKAEDDELRAVGAATLEVLLDADNGPGACGKCHRAGLAPTHYQKGRPIDDVRDWRFTGPSERPHFWYSHRPHINILGPSQSCETCHKISQKGDYASYFKAFDSEPDSFVSNFSTIDKRTCDNCHRPGRIQYGCQTCHRYHRATSFKRDLKLVGIQTDESQSQ